MASLVFGILALVVLPLIGSVAAIVLGHGARSRIRRSGGRLRGDGMAVAGLVLGYVSLFLVGLGVLAAVVVFAAGDAGNDAKDRACAVELRTVQTAAAAYYADRGVPPSNSGELVGPYLEEPPRYYEFTNLNGSLRFRSLDPACPEPG
ncbi:MAG: DUF4190 domain-containing protein [Microthrixaceae bacterium]